MTMMAYVTHKVAGSKKTCSLPVALQPNDIGKNASVKQDAHMQQY